MKVYYSNVVLLTLLNCVHANDPHLRKYKNVRRQFNKERINPNNSTSRIIGGVDVPTPNPYRYTAYLGDAYIVSEEVGCAASLISPNLLLTSFLCAEATTATIGQRDLNGDDFKEFTILEMHLHPDFVATTLENDFMLLLLDGVSSISPVKLDDGVTDPVVGGADGDRVRALGWGDLEETVLQQVDLSTLSNDQCDANYFGYYGYYDTIYDSMMCAAPSKEDGDKGVCIGDSGGPLIDIKTKKLVGVASMVRGCGEYDIPGVYGRVRPVVDWIERLSGAMAPSDSTVVTLRIQDSKGMEKLCLSTAWDSFDAVLATCDAKNKRQQWKILPNGNVQNMQIRGSRVRCLWYNKRAKYNNKIQVNECSKLTNDEFEHEYLFVFNGFHNTLVTGSRVGGGVGGGALTMTDGNRLNMIQYLNNKEGLHARNQWKLTTRGRINGNLQQEEVKQKIDRRT